MNKGIFLAGLGIFTYCITQSIIDISYIMEMNNIDLPEIKFN